MPFGVSLHIISLQFLICRLKEVGRPQWLVPLLSYKALLFGQKSMILGGGDAISLILSTSFEASLLESCTHYLHSLSLSFFVCEIKGLKPTF